jgi:hypothetical protein
VDPILLGMVVLAASKTDPLPNNKKERQRSEGFALPSFLVSTSLHKTILKSASPQKFHGSEVADQGSAASASVSAGRGYLIWYDRPEKGVKRLETRFGWLLPPRSALPSKFGRLHCSESELKKGV